MTKRKRTSHIPQGAPRKRRPVRRAFDSTTTAAESVERTDLDGDAIFVDAAPMTFAGITGGPIDTRPQATRAAQPARSRGRRIEQLRRSGGSSAEFAAAHVTNAPLPVYERSFLLSELRSIAVISTVLLGVIIALTLVLR